jgi:hypothetical protein
VLGPRGRLFTYGHFLGVFGCSFWWQNMTQEYYVILKELALFQVSRNHWNTFHRLCRCSQNVQPITITSSRYIRHDLWGPLIRFLLAVQTSMGRCRGQRAWPWIATALDLLRTPSSPYCQGVAIPARVENHLSQGSVSIMKSMQAVGNSLSL